MTPNIHSMLSCLTQQYSIVIIANFVFPSISGWSVVIRSLRHASFVLDMRQNKRARTGNVNNTILHAECVSSSTVA